MADACAVRISVQITACHCDGDATAGGLESSLRLHRAETPCRAAAEEDGG